MGKFDRCKTCSADLVDGPDAERSGSSDRFECRIRGIPTRTCPHGHPGSYWYWLDFGVEVMDLLGADSQSIARRRLGILKTRSLCRSCGAELVDRGEREKFTLRGTLRKGTDLVVSITAPALTCPQCGARHLPAQASSTDPYYAELAELLGTTAGKGLIRE